MSSPYLKASEAARRLGISAKALRLYEARGLVAPARTAAGWRAYGPDEMQRASEIASLRALGFSLAEVARALKGGSLEPALAAHQAALEQRIRALGAMAAKVRGLRDDLAKPCAPAALAFDLPWPWGGERFVLPEIVALTYITGPLGSGKTRLALRIAETVPGAMFLGLARDASGCDADPALAARVAPVLASLVAAGATTSDALVALLAGLEADGPRALVVDLVEQGLDEPTQRALAACLRRRGPEARPVFVLTRSSAILDLDAVGPSEAILYCPANHGVPFRVAPTPGSLGREALALCLATPEVRARTAGTVAVRLAG
ncbi:MAG TPA: MerR family transcriptional regulator [Rhizomicrobium sp.]|nr:MerR family transcriptional regulator [Rhizomicrobium sp.]